MPDARVGQGGFRARQRARRDDARTRVRTVAIQVFQQEGFEGTTMKLLADRAGLSVGMIYQLYEGKADVLLDVVRTHNAAQWDVLEALAAQCSGFEGLIQLFAASYGFDLRIPQLAGIVMAQAWLWEMDRELRHREDVARFQGYIAAVVRRGHPHASAADVTAVAEGAHDIYVRGLRAGVFDGATPEQCAQRLRPVLAVLMRGLGTESRGTL
jgi:AcrR family transcriptional regulator